MITRRHLIQHGTSAMMAVALVPKATVVFAGQTGSSVPALPRAPVGEEIWSLKADSDIDIYRHSWSEVTPTPSYQCLVMSSGQMANIDMDNIALVWESPTPFPVDTSRYNEGWSSLYPLYGASRARLIDASSGEVVFDTPISSGSVWLSNMWDEIINVGETNTITGNYGFRFFHLDTGEELWALESLLDYMWIDETVIAVMPDLVASYGATGVAGWATDIPDVKTIRSVNDVLLASSPTELTAIDPETGDMLWIAPVLDERRDWRFLEDYGLLVIAQNRLILVDLETGLETWATPFDSEPSLDTYQGRSALIREGGTLKMIDLESGAVPWESGYADDLTPYPVSESRWRVRAGETITILAMDEARVIWESKDWLRARFSEEYLFIENSQSEILCFSMVTGRQLWKSPFTRDRGSDVVLTFSGGVLGLIIDNGPCTVFDSETGQVVRTIPNTSRSYTTSSRITSGFALYFRNNNTVGIKRMSTGDELGVLPCTDPESISIGASSITTDRAIAILGADGLSVIAQISLDPGTTFAPTADQQWLVYDAFQVSLYGDTGELLWQLPLDVPISHIRHVPEVFLIAFDAHSWVVNRTDGQILWQFPAGMDTGSLQEVSMSGNRLVFIAERRASIFEAPQATEVSRDITLRAAPSANAVERGQLTRGTEVVLTENTRKIRGATWVEVRVGDITGWIPKDVLTTSTVPTASPAASPSASPSATPTT